MPGKSIAFVIEKGGTGKSTICFNTGWEMSKTKKVLLVDLDGQMANLTYFCDIPKTEELKTIVNILNGENGVDDAIINVKENLDILPADNSLMDIRSPEHVRKICRENGLSSGNEYLELMIERMQDFLATACSRYDYVLLDPNPTPNFLHTLSLCAVNYVVIPVLPDAASIVSDEGTAESIQIIKENEVNPDLKVLGILFNRDTNRTNLSKQVKDIIQEYAEAMDTSVFESSIRNAVILGESVGMHVGITDYRPSSSAAEDIRNVVNEIQRRISDGN